MVWWLLACSDAFEHPEIREGEAELDPNNPADETGDSEADDTAAPSDSEPEDTGDSEPEDTGDSEPGPEEVCYPGAAEDYTACLPLIDHSTSWGSDYTYPEPYGGSEQYSAPVRFIDLTVADPDLSLAPNFVLGEVMQEYKGDYGMYQVHVMEYLQVIRDTTAAPLYVNSGYRNVSYNAGVGGATYSRHMYGDAVDMYSNDASLSELAAICEDLGADYVSEYTSHVHCDWRDDALDVAFFDVGRAAASAPPTAHDAALVPGAAGAWQAPATGFDEGEPRRLWAAWDAAGALLLVGEGEAFVPPADAARLSVEIGGQVVVSTDLD